MRHVRGQRDKISEIFCFTKYFAPLMILTTLIYPVETFICGLLILETIWKLLAKLFDQVRAPFSDPVRAGVEASLHDMSVNVITLKSVVDPHQIPNVSVFFLSGKSSFPALPIWKYYLSFLDCAKELCRICFAILQESLSTWSEFNFSTCGQTAVATAVMIHPILESVRVMLVQGAE